MTLENDSSIVVLTPLAAEYHEMVAMLSDASPADGFLAPATRGRVGKRSVLVVQSGKGQEATSAKLALVLERTDAGVVLLIGIAGGSPALRVKKGDVVVARHIYAIEFGKLQEAKFKRRPDPDVSCDVELGLYAENLARHPNSLWRSRIRPARPDLSSNDAVTVHTDCYVASMSKVVDDPDHALFAIPASHVDEIHAVEMEGVGAGASVRQAQSGRVVQFLMIRGISDEPGESADGSTVRACGFRRCRSPSSVDGDHPVRSMAITDFG